LSSQNETRTRIVDSAAGRRQEANAGHGIGDTLNGILLGVDMRIGFYSRKRNRKAFTWMIARRFKRVDEA